MGQFFGHWVGGLVFNLIGQLLYCNMTRNVLLHIIERAVDRRLKPSNKSSNRCRTIERERYLMARAVLQSVDRALRKKIVSKRVLGPVMKLWAEALLTPMNRRPAMRQFKQVYECQPPGFITISPGHACNMSCSGCYADSGQADKKLSWTVVDRLIADAKNSWGIHLVVFSGGEPLLYESEGKDLLDIVEKHPDLLFLMFTNGTLIDRDVAGRMGRLGNLTPALSVEGMRGSTDSRRGDGVFNRVLDAMRYLRTAGVPFGIAVTATATNGEEILSDRFLDFFFEEQGAFYSFYFQYVPIGRNPDFDIMPGPGQRVEFRRRCWDMVEGKKLFLIDFWNHGTMIGGCISAGREQGYFYIDWDGKVMPCVFVPYAACNINDIYAEGKTLNDIWGLPFFQAIRQWQRDYGYSSPELTKDGDWLRPCPFRDHHAMFQRMIEQFKPEPEDEGADRSSADERYHKKLIDYGEQLEKSYRGIWEKEYVRQQYCGRGRGL